MEIKANLSQRLVEVEAELGKIGFCDSNQLYLNQSKILDIKNDL